MNRLRGRLNISVNKTPVDFSFQVDEEDSETDTEDTEVEENQESEEDVLSAERLEEEAEDPVVLD